MTKNRGRKERRRDGTNREKEDEKRAKAKKLQKRQENARPVKKVRMLADGSIGFGHKAKLGRTGLIVIICITAGLIFFMGGLNGWYDQFAPEGYQGKFIPPMSFEECKDIDFNDDLCTLDYRFCREYADGEYLCQYAEEDPFVNVDPDEVKYTEEEQDFLAPTSIDPWVGLSCMEMLDFSATEEHVALSVDEHLEFHTYYMGICADMSNDMDMTIPGEDQDFLPPILDFIFGWFPQEAHAEERNHFTIGIYKSNSCKAQTQAGDNGSCPTYGALAQMFDNTNQAMSGEFVWSDYDNDVYRVAPDFKDHHNFYQYAGLPTILAVDPDTKWFNCCMSAQIFIEPSGFTFFEHDELSVDTTIWENDAEQRAIKEKLKLLDELREAEPEYFYTDEDDEDLDDDGILDENDDCIREKEDYNGFEDHDGCADDKDGDGIKGENDDCPFELEDFNGYEDADGCIDDFDYDEIVGNKCKTQEWIDEYKREHIDDEIRRDGTSTRNPDPDCFVDMDECPNQPENYNRFEDTDGCPDLAEHAGELVTHKNVYIDGCSFARVAANMTLITQTINYFWNNCEGTSPELSEYTYIPSIPINYDDHIWYKYSEWINQKALECRVKC